MNDACPILIVGQGLAGSILALSFHSHNIPFEIIDNHRFESSSMTAGGIMHPITFKKLKLAWNGYKFCNYSIAFFKKYEELLNADFFKPMPLIREIKNEDELNLWKTRIEEEPELKETLKILTDRKGEVRYAGKLHVENFLKAVYTFFKSKITLGEFQYDEIIINTDETVSYKEKTYRKIIFCEGYKFTINPYFSYLPKNLTHGEILKINAQHIDKEVIQSKNGFVAQHCDDTFILGSTYRWNETQPVLTEDGKEELLEKAKKLGLAEFKIEEQLAGIRPTTPDRRPYVGFHRDYHAIGIFGGMGSKTVMQAPFLADNFSNHIVKDEPLLSESKLSRFNHKIDDYEAT